MTLKAAPELSDEQMLEVAKLNIDQLRPRWWRLRRDGISASFGIAPAEMSSVTATKAEIKRTMNNLKAYLYDQLALVEATEKDVDVAREICVSAPAFWPQSGKTCDLLEDNVWRCGVCKVGLVLPLWAWQCSNCEARVSMVDFHPLAQRRYFKHHVHR